MNEAEKAITDFIDYCDGKILIEENTGESKIEKVEMEAYGDRIYYKNGTKEFISIGD
jgi:hypothetical protein